MTFGEKLYRLRKERGMSQEALAQELGVSRQAISRWELGEVAPDTGNVLAASRLFGVSTDYLLRDECEREADTPAAHRAEQSLQERQAAVGKGFLVRVCCLSPLILFQLGRISVKQGLDYTPAPVTYLLLLQAVFCALLFREYWRHLKQNDGWYQKVRSFDTLAFACMLVVPYLLEEILGTFSVLVALVVASLFITCSVKRMRLHYGLPWGKRR